MDLEEKRRIELARLAERTRNYAKTERGKANIARKGRLRRESAQGRLKDQIRSKVARALRSGKLVRLPCKVCGAPKVEAHHEDYSKPLTVIWLCRKHHNAVHGKYTHVQ